MFDTTPNHYKSVLAHQFFVAPADENYFFARFSRIFGMDQNFYWQALQTIEKYLKACLILNGISVRKSSHDIEKLWNAHLQISGDLAFKSLAKPPLLSPELWRNVSLESFLRNVNRMGHPDGRYGLTSYHNRFDDLFIFDQLAFELRRRTIGLDWIVGADWNDENLRDFYGKPYRDVIQLCPQYQFRGVSTSTGSFERSGPALEDTWYAWNFAYFRKAEDIERLAPRTIAPQIKIGNSHLALIWEVLTTKPISPAVREGVTWLLDNVKIDGEAEKQFRAKIKL